MITFLIIVGVLIVSVVGLGLYSIQSRRPKFFSGDLKSLEKKLFEEFKNGLSLEAQKLLTVQLSRPKKGVRLYFDKSYSLELYDDNKDFAFPRKDGSKIGTVTFKFKDEKYTATFPTYIGRVSGIDVRPSPKKFLNKDNIEVIKVKITNDPMEKIDLTVIPEYYSETDELPDLLKKLSQEFRIRNIRKALPEKQRELFIKTCDTKLPDDFLELSKETDGFEIDDTQVHGLSDMEPVSMDNGYYLKLIETSDGFVTLKQSKRTTKLMYFSIEDETVQKGMGQSFLDALREVCAKGTTGNKRYAPLRDGE
jgi:hypothetical protein